MSAIAGLINFSFSPDRTSHVELMLKSIKHRYNETPQVSKSGAALLGWGAFPVTEEEKNIKEPFCKGKFILLLDGRLDNRGEVYHGCGFNQKPLCQISDHELFIEAYKKWDESCIQKIDGDFAFALWDGEKLFCGRDRFGVKPFFYYHSSEFFLFASEAKALLASGLVEKKLNLEYCSFHFVPEIVIQDQISSFYKGIYRLPPAHTLVVRDGKIGIKQYWKIEPDHSSECKKESDYYEKIRELFKKSIAAKMRAAGGVGTALSGGIDSSSVTCAARDYYRDKNLGPLHSFSCLFESSSDETEWIQPVLGEGDILPHYVYPDRVSPMEYVMDMLWLHEGPYLGGNNDLQIGLYREARKQGIRVFLDGEDGDGIMSHGYDRFVQLAQFGEWERFFTEASGVSRNFGKDIPFYSRAATFDKYALPYLQHLLIKGRLIRLYKDFNEIHRVTNVSRKKFLRTIFAKRPEQLSFKDTILNPSIAKKYHLEERLRELRSQSIIGTYPAADNRLHYIDMALSGNAYILESADRVASFCGVELRHPFFSRELAEFALSVPSEFKLKEGMTRQHFRKAMKGILPEKIRLRGGKGDLSFQAYDRYRNYCSEMIDRKLRSIGRDDPFLNLDEVERIRRAYIDDKDDTKLMDVWDLTAYQMWRESL